jgi:hypothetical protein
VRRSSRWYREWYPWPLSAAGTSRSNSGRLAGLTLTSGFRLELAGLTTWK